MSSVHGRGAPLAVAGALPPSSAVAVLCGSPAAAPRRLFAAPSSAEIERKAEPIFVSVADELRSAASSPEKIALGLEPFKAFFDAKLQPNARHGGYVEWEKGPKKGLKKFASIVGNIISCEDATALCEGYEEISAVLPAVETAERNAAAAAMLLEEALLMLKHAEGELADKQGELDALARGMDRKDALLLAAHATIAAKDRELEGTRAALATMKEAFTKLTR